jgi:hypothetical protein
MIRLVYFYILSCDIVLCLLLGCHKRPQQNDTSKVQNESSTSEKKTPIYDSTYLSLDSLRNAMINDEDCGWIRLKDGVYKTDSDKVMGHVNITISHSFTFADLDGDGYKDAIGSIAAKTGGSGVFISMDVFLNKHGRAVHTASYNIGDREGIDSIKVIGDTINLYHMKRASGEAMASASFHEHKKFKLSGNKLIELE